MQNKKVLGIVLILVIAIVAGAWYLTQKNTNAGEGQEQVSTAKSFDSDSLKLSFMYPALYALSQRDFDYTTVKGVTITMLPSDVVIPENSEGPAGITISVLENPNNTALADFIRKAVGGSSGAGSYDFQETTLKGMEAIAYTSTGLYESDSIAVAHSGKVYIFSASWLTREDQTLTDLNAILESVTFK